MVFKELESLNEHVSLRNQKKLIITTQTTHQDNHVEKFASLFSALKDAIKTPVSGLTTARSLATLQPPAIKRERNLATNCSNSKTQRPVLSPMSQLTNRPEMLLQHDLDLEPEHFYNDPHKENCFKPNFFYATQDHTSYAPNNISHFEQDFDGNFENKKMINTMRRQGACHHRVTSSTCTDRNNPYKNDLNAHSVCTYRDTNALNRTIAHQRRSSLNDAYSPHSYYCE